MVKLLQVILRWFNFFKQKQDKFLASSMCKRVMLIAPEAQNMYQSLLRISLKSIRKIQ